MIARKVLPALCSFRPSTAAISFCVTPLFLFQATSGQARPVMIDFGQSYVVGGSSRHPPNPWNINDNLFIGEYSTDSDRRDDGRVSARNIFLGFTPTSHGTLTVSGADSHVSSSATVDVGVGGTGVLNISGGASFSTATTTVVGGSFEGHGTVSIDGNGTTYSNGGTFAVGVGSEGQLEVTDGAALNTQRFYLSFSGATGLTTVSGSNSTLTTSGETIIGRRGRGELTLSNGGRVIVGSDGSGTLDIAKPDIGGTNSRGTLNIGAAEGSAATSPGFISAKNVVFGRSTGEIVFNHTSDNYSFAPNISGPGSVRFVAGTTILNGTNSYTGTTTVQGGTLSGNTASLQGDITIDAGATLEFNQSTNGSYEGDLTGSGALEKTGSGTLTLDGDEHAFTGIATIRQGMLLVGSSPVSSGAVLPGSVVIGQDGMLGGHGSINGNVSNNGGRIAPGSSIGTTTINGNYSGAGTLEIEVQGEADPTLDASDQLIVNGTFDASDTVLEVLFLQRRYGQNFVPTSTLVIVENDGADSIIGTFADVEDNLAFFDSSLDYATGTGNDIALSLVRNSVSYADLAQTRNQSATVAAIESLGSSNPLHMALLAANANGSDAREAYDLTSGEINASARAILIDDARYVRQRINDHLFAIGKQRDDGLVEPEKTAAIGSLSFWTEVYGSYASFGGDGNAATTDRNVGGMLFGADGEVHEFLRLGLVAGFSRSDFNVSSRLSSGDSENYTVGGYAQLPQINALPVSLQGGAVATWHQLRFDREVTGLIADELESDQNATTLQVFGELGYDWQLGEARMQPFVGVAYVHLFSKGYREQGNDAALSADNQNEGITFTTLGLRSDWDFSIGGLSTTLSGLAAWQYASQDTINFTQAFISGGNPFTITSVPISQNVALLEAGLDAHLTDTARLGAAYYGLLSDDAQDHGFNIRLLWQY